MKIRSLLFILLLIATPSWAVDVVNVPFEWDANLPEEEIATYMLYPESVSGGIVTIHNPIPIPVSSLLDPDNPSHVLKDVSKGSKYYFKLTAINEDGYESPPTPKIDINLISPGTPQRFRTKPPGHN